MKTMQVEWKQLNALRVGQTVLIRRTSGAEQKAVVIDLPEGREYRAPEVPQFQVEFVCDATGRGATRWCSAFDLLPWPETWARCLGPSDDDDGLRAAEDAVERHYEDRYDSQSPGW